MLDKSIPYAEIWMYREKDTPVNEQNLPEGFQFEFYQISDEHEWAAIETAVAEFENETQSLDYFAKSFAPYPEVLQPHMLFITNDSREKIRTASAWWKETPNDDRYPLVHWVAVKPGY